MAENLFTQLAQDTLAGLAAAPQTSGSSESTAGDDPVSAIVQVAQERGIDPAHLLGLAKLETRFGEKSVKGGGADTRNLFNVKDFSKAGNGIAARDNAEGSNDRYRQYGSYRESAEDLVSLLERKYPAALQARSPEEFAQALKQGGYATDPLYERKLANTIRSNSDRVAAVRPAVSAQEWDQGARYIPMESMVGTDKPKPAEEGVIDGVTSLGKAVWQGAKSLGRSVMASGNTAVGDLSDVELLAEAQKADAKNNPRAMMALQEEIAKRKEANPDAKWWQALGDVGDAAWKNKLGTAQLIANQAPNSAVALGGAWAGGVAGAQLGAMAAPFTGGLSVPVGAGLGALTGMFLGNYAMEAGGKALDKAEGGFTPEEARQSMTEGAKKAAVVTAVDTATLGAGKLLGRTVFGAPVRAGARAEAQVLADAGVDITSKAAIARAVANNQALKEAAIEAGKQAAKDASKFGTRAAQAGIDFGMETAGEGVGEYYGEVAATGKGDIYDAALEALSSASQSGVQTMHAMRSAEGNHLDPSGIVRAARQSGGIVSRAGLASTPGAQQPVGQPGQPVQPNQAGAATATAGSTAVPGGNAAAPVGNGGNGAANAQQTANATAAPNPYFDGVPDEGLESIWRNLTTRQTMTDGTPITDEDRKLGQDALAELQRRRAVAAAQSNQPPAAGQQNAIQSSAMSAIEQALEADKARKRAAGEVVEDDVTDVVAKDAPKDARPSIIDPTSGELVKDGDPRYDMVLQAKGSAALAMNTVAPTEAQTKGAKPGLSEESDPMLPQAIDVLRQGGRASVSQIQGKLKIGFNRAARLLDEMESQGIVSAMDEKGLRKILKLPDPPDAQANAPEQPANSAGFSLPAFDNSPIPKMDPAAAEEQRRQAAEFEQKRKVRRAATRSAAWDRNPFLAFLGANGINRDVANEFAPGLVEKRKAFVPGYGPVFRSGAKNLDELVQNAREEGFLREDDDVPELYDLIERSLRGERIAPLYADGAAEAEGQRRQQEMMEREGATFEDYLQQAEADDFDPFPLMADSGYDAQDLAGTDFDQADDAVRAEVAALAAQYADLGFDPADVLESLSVETENQPEQAYYDRARTRLTDLINQAYAQAQPQSGGAVRADRPEPLPAGEAGARGPAAGQQVRPAAPTPKLRNVDELAAEGFNRVVKQGGKTYFVNPDTRESVELDSPAQIARARARVQAKQRLGSLRNTRPQDFALDAVTPEALKARDEQAQAAQAQQTAEQQAAADKAKADDERKRIEQASYAAADSFELGQNPLDSLTGQQDIFSTAPVSSPVAADLAGERINGEWVAFDPQSGTLGIPRAQMPQIKAEHRGAMINFLKARGIDGQQETIPSAAIKPTQAEFSPAKVKQAMDYQGGNRSIIVSADGYVVDGHHQWLAAREKGEPIPAIRLDQNIGDVLTALKDMPSAQPEQGGRQDAARDYESDMRLYPSRVLEQVGANGELAKLYAKAGVRGADAFGGLSADDRAAAYAAFVADGGKPAGNLPQSYNDSVMEEERQIRRRQLQDERTITQANGKPFKTEASAKVMLDQFDLSDTHKIVSEGGGYALRQMPPAEQAEVRRKAEGRESYMEAQAAVIAEMGIPETADGEIDATDDQWDEIDQRIAERLGRRPVASEQPAATPAQQDSQAAADSAGFDSAAFDKARNDTIQASRDAGNTHLDQVPAYVETMRGKAIFYVHDPKVTGVIRTIDNNKNVYVDWSDAYSAEKEMASPTQEGKKTVYRSTIGPRDLKDYALAPDKREQGSQDAASQQGITADDVAAAEKQAAQMIEARIDGMKAPEVQRIAARFLPTVGVKVPMGKAKIKAAMTDATAMNLLAPAGELGIELSESVKRALVAKMEGRVGQPTQDQADPGKINFAPSDQETGPFGPILTKFRGDAQGAIKALTELQDGEAVAALNHPEVGDIDLVWGKEGTAEKEYEDGMGLAKIIRKHSEVLDDLQGFMNSLSVQKRSQNRVILANRGGRALVRLDWDGKAKHWLLTAYDDEKKASVANGGRTGVSVGADSAPPAEQGTEADTSLSQAAQGVQAAYQANPDLEAIFDQLDGLTQRTQADGQRAAAAHPKAERIQFVQKHILDILQDLEDSGKVSINC